MEAYTELFFPARVKKWSGQNRTSLTASAGPGVETVCQLQVRCIPTCICGPCHSPSMASSATALCDEGAGV